MNINNFCIHICLCIYVRLTLALTVLDFQTCNQLLNPSYPVLVHPRPVPLSGNTQHPNKDGSRPHSSSVQLMLPGLYQVTDTVPALHLYFQQKLYNAELNPHNYDHDDADDTVQIAPIKVNKGVSFNLQYFEMVTIWLAPMEVNLDDEVIVRSMRYVNAIRSHVKRPDLGSYRRQKEEILLLQHQSNKVSTTSMPNRSYMYT